MSQTRVPAIPSPTDANLREVARAIKGVLDVREGLLGDPLDAVVKFRDLVDAGVVEVALTRRGGGSAGLVVLPAAPDSGYDPTKDLNPPPAPQGFAVSGLFAAVQLSWQLPAIQNYAFTEIWRADTNVLGSAVRIATTPAAIYSDFIGNSATKFYWVRFVTQADVSGPYNATEGTAGTTSPDPAYLLSLLTGQITESQLYESLGDRINLIDGSGTGSVNARIADEAFARGQAIAAEALSRLSADQSLQDQINLLSSGTSGDLSALIAAVNNETAARIAADLSESDARALADTTLASAIDAEETARSIGDDVLSAVSATLATGVAHASTMLRQETDARVLADAITGAALAATGIQAGQTAAALIAESSARIEGDAAVATTTSGVVVQAAGAVAAVTVEQQARAAADEASAQQVASLAASLGDNAAALQVEQSTRIGADSALSEQTTTLAAHTAQTAAGLQVAQQVQADSSSALASQTTGLAAAMGENVAGLRTEQLARADADQATATQLDTLAVQGAQGSAALAQEQQARIDQNGALAAQTTTLTARVDLGDAQLSAGLVIEQQARADADGALSGQVVSLAAQAGEGLAALRVEQEVRASETGVLATQTAALAATAGDTAAGLRIEQQARASADEATAAQTVSLSATAAGLEAAILTEQTVRAAGDSSTASQVSTLASRVEVGDATNAAAIQQEQLTRATIDAAQAAQTVVLSSAVGETASAVRTETEVRSSETQALALQSQSIGANVGGALAGLVIEQEARAAADYAAASTSAQLAATLGQTTAGLSTEQAVSADRDSALASQTSQLVASVGGVAAGLTTEQQVRAGADEAAALQVIGVAAQAAGSAAGLQQEQQARASADEAVGRQLNTISADVGANAAGIQAEQQARASADVSVASQLTLLVAKTDDTAAALVTETLTRATETSAIAATATRLATQFASGALLPFDFSTGKTEWTNASGGSPSAVPQPSGTVITNDPDFGTCLEITDFDTVGEALLTRQVLPATQGKVYRIVTRLKIVSSDGSIQLGHLAAGLLGDYSLVGTSNLGTTTISGAALGDGSLNGAGAGNVTLSGTGVFTISSMASSSSGAQFGAWPAGSAWVRLGVRLGTAEAGLVVRVGSIRIEEVTASAGLAMEAFTRSTQDDALSKQVLTLSSEVGNTAAALQVASTTQASGDSALASQVTTLQASAAGNTVAIQAEAFVRASETGALGAKYAVKIDNAGHVSGFGLASEANDAAPVSSFGIRADNFFVTGPATVSATAPTTVLYKGRVWVDSSVTPNVTRYYTGSAWSTTPQVLPFTVLTSPGTINGVSVPAGVYIDTAFIADATITSAKIANLAVDNAKIADLNVDKLNGSALKVGAFIQSTNFVSGANGTGWRINADGTAELQAAFIRGRVTASQIDGSNLEINAAGVELGANVGPGVGHSGLSLSSSNFNNIFLRRESDGVVFFRINEGGDQSLTFDSSSGILSIRGSINGGSYTGYAWPASGTGFHLGPSGLLLGNANTGGYFQVGANGDVYAPGMSIVNGTLGISQANVINTINIASRAVTVPVYVNNPRTGGSYLVESFDFVAIDSVTINRRGFSTLITWNGQLDSVSGDTAYRFVIYRGDGVQIGNVFDFGVASRNSFTMIVSDDSTGTGVTTYTLYIALIIAQQGRLYQSFMSAEQFMR